MKGLNKVQLIGNLGKDPEIRYTPEGKQVAKFSMAANRTFKNIEEIVGTFAEDIGLTREPPQKYFKGQLFSRIATCGNIRVAVTEKRNRIAISTHYKNAHLRSFQLLIIARVAASLGKKPKIKFSQEFAHMDLSHWFPEGKQARNQIQL